MVKFRTLSPVTETIERITSPVTCNTIVWFQDKEILCFVCQEQLIRFYGNELQLSLIAPVFEIVTLLYECSCA